MSDSAEPSCHYTYRALHDWHKHAFEKLGWMVLAASRPGCASKLISYYESLECLQKAIQQKMSETEDADRKCDLCIICEQVQCLRKHVKGMLAEVLSE